MTHPYQVTDYKKFKTTFPHLEPKTEPPFTCKWEVENVDVIPSKEGLSDVIHIVHIKVTREGATESKRIPVQVASENMVAKSFIPFDEVKEESVVEWVKEVLTKLRQDFVWDIEWATPAASDTVVRTLKG
mgnify:CR=1 FL=1